MIINTKKNNGRLVQKRDQVYRKTKLHQVDLPSCSVGIMVLI